MQRFTVALLAAGFVGLIAPAAARAEFIAWKYNWSRNPSVIMADDPGTGRITLTDEGLRGAAGDSDIVATNIRTFSDATRESPDIFTAKPFTLTLFLMDEESEASGTLAFNAEFNGTLSALHSDVRAQFVGDTTQTLLLGNHRYTVSIGPYTPPGPPGSSNSGAVAATAEVTIEVIQKTPEPSTLVLAVVGLPLLGVGAWRRRRA